jgi:peptidoglycan/LPS O-acetylase OafA/YrhL
MTRYDMPRRSSSDISLREIESPRDRHPPPSNYSTYNPRSRSQTSQSTDDEEASISRVEKGLTQLGLAIVPSFLQRAIGGEPPPPAKLHDIAALDGLRGWACLLVFNFHFLFTYTWQVGTGWGFGGGNFGIHQLPFIHMLISGHIMVAIFFVVSGYVLSFRPLKLIRSRSWEQTFAVLSSATFRRGLRLYIPSIVGTICVFIAIRMGLYDYSQKVVDEGHTIAGTNEQHPPILRTTYAQFWDWYYTVVRLMSIWDWSLYYNNYNPHLWTIPVEFRSSMVLFITILGTSRFRTKVRMGLVAALIWYSVRWGRWDVVLFLCGMVMAEIDQINGIWSHNPMLAMEKPENQGPIKRFFWRNERILWIFVFIAGLYMGSSPNTGVRHTPGYMWLGRLIPETYPEPHRFPQTIGAVLIVHSINNSKPIQKLFVNSVSQYLGKISYAFYIVHGPILHSLGYSIMPSIWRCTGKETNFQFCMGLFVGWLICLPISLWAGDIFWRAVDIPSVKFARWLEGKIVVKSGGGAS